jgi:hypothetical protein
VGIAAAALVDVDVVQVTFDESVDAGAGTWGLQVRSDIRDVAGNRLDGAWVGVPSDYFGVFGDAPSAATPVDSCEPSVYLFRPDGDDGAGAEADQVTLTMTTGAAPAQWIVSVWDGGGQRVLQERVWGTGSVGTFEWDGRDQSERVVSNGNYAIEVDADDGSGNRGGACTTVVSVDNAFGD